MKWFEEFLKRERTDDIGVGKVENKRIYQLAQHLDNASLHFKSIEAIEILTHLFEETTGKNPKIALLHHLDSGTWKRVMGKTHTSRY